MQKQDKLPQKAQGSELPIFTINTAKMLEYRVNAEQLNRNCEAVARIIGILWKIGARMSKAPSTIREFAHQSKLAPRHGVSTRDWEASHDGLTRIGLTIRFDVGGQAHEAEILRVKFNCMKSNSMLLKGSEIVRTEVLVWDPEKRSPEDMDLAFAKVEAKLVEMARKVVQHEINRKLFLHLAAKHNGSAEDALVIPEKNIMAIDDMVKVRDSGDRTYYSVEGKYTESLQAAIDFAIFSFEKKHGLAGAQEADGGRNLAKYISDKLPESIKLRSNGKKNALSVLTSLF